MLKPLILFLLVPFATQDPRDVPDPVDLKAETIALQPKVITHFAIGAKGKVVYTVDKANTIRAWDIKKEEFLWETDPAPDTATTMALAVSEKTLATCLGAPAYSLYNLKDGTSEDGASGLATENMTTCIAFDPKGKWIWLGGSKGGATRLTPGSINGWSTRSLENGGTLSLALDAKAKQMAVGGKDGSVRFINPSSSKKEEETSFEIHKSGVTAVAFGPKGKVLAVGASDGSLALIELKKGEQLQKFEGHEAAITKLAIDPKGRWLVSGDIKGNLFMWNLEDGIEPAKLGVRARGPVAGIFFLNKGATLMTTTGNQSVQVWDLSELDD